MSATIDARRIAEFLGGCPAIEVAGRVHPIDVRYAPGVEPDQAIAGAVPRNGALLCFLPGAGEIRRTAERLTGRLAADVAIWPLHGGLDADAQDAALAPSVRPRVILATNLAETTLTVPDVTVVVDSGLHKVARYDPDRAIDSLDTERIARDSADQRAGRAGRTAPGTVIRLWDARDRLRAEREPDLARIDLAATTLDVIAWGGDPRTLEWFEAPPAAAIDAALQLLRRIGAIDARNTLTTIGEQLRRLPLHPRLGRLLIGAAGAPAAARACALLSERHAIPPRHGATVCDLLSAVDRERDLPPHVLRVARELRDAFTRASGSAAAERVDDEAFRRAVLAGYPDRVARRREAKSDRFLLASGAGARLARESGAHDAEFVVAVDVAGGSARQNPDALIRLATGIERGWLTATSAEVRHELHPDRGAVRATRVDLYDAIVIGERNTAVDPEAAEKLIEAAVIARGPTDADARLLRRLAFAGVPLTFDSLVQVAVVGARSIEDVQIAAHLPADAKRKLEKLAPAELALPGGRRARVDYRDDGRPVVATRLQDVFGLNDTPRLGERGVPVTFELLSPNGRPVQVTSDLRSFWTGAYQELMPALRARYPKHRW